MVEAICVISVFILFFLGMVYFESLYRKSLRVYQLARAAAVADAMGGCLNPDPLAAIQQDLQGSSGTNSQPTSSNPPAVIGSRTTSRSATGRAIRSPAPLPAKDSRWTTSPTSGSPPTPAPRPGAACSARAGASSPR